MSAKFLTRISLAALLAIGCTATGLHAQMGPGGPGGDHHMMGGPHGSALAGPPGRWWNDPRMATAVGLTPDQTHKMDDVMQSHRIELIDAMANVQKAEALLDPLVEADTPNENAILAQIGKVAEARAELEKAHARMLLAIRAQLTPAQWTKLKTLRPPMEHRDFGPGHGPGNDMGRDFGHGPDGGPGSGRWHADDSSKQPGAPKPPAPGDQQ